MSISGERIRDELIKIMSSNKPSISFEYMRETGLLKKFYLNLQTDMEYFKIDSTNMMFIIIISTAAMLRLPAII